MNRTAPGRKLAVRAAASGAILASTALLVLVGTNPPAQGSPANGPSEFTLKLTDQADHLVDVAPRGGDPSMGDYVAFRKNVLTPSGVRVGSVQAHAMVTAPGKNARVTLEGVIILKGGLLAVVETFRFNDTRHHIAITGGTEKYEGATGSITSGLPGQGPEDVLFRIWTK
jgi:hypothetical protein